MLPEPKDTALDVFKRLMAERTHPKILLTGAHVWEGSFQVDYTSHAPNARWVTTDITGNVDIVTDLQKIPDEYAGTFDGIYCPATLEHIERPWCAIHEMVKCLKPNGVLFISTHQTFPLHGYPNDYFRFSTEALNVMCFDSGLHVVESAYSVPCTITPQDPESVNVWNTIAKSYLNVSVCAVKASQEAM